MIVLTKEDYDIAISALEYFITTREEELILSNAGDVEWDTLTPCYNTLNNLKLCKTLEGKDEHKYKQGKISL